MDCKQEQTIPDIVNVEEKLNNELKDHFKGQKDGFVQVGPKKWLYPMKYRAYAQKLLDFEVRPDDVWITGIPRSGTTVTQELAWLLSHELNFEGAKDPMIIRVPFFEQNIIFVDEYLASLDENRFAIYSECIPDKLGKTKKRRVIKTHLPFELLPSDIFDKNCKVIYVYRYPKDVAVSYFHLQCQAQHIKFNGDFKRYWNFFQNGNCMFGPYFEHVKQGFEKKNMKNVLVVCYEDLKADLDGYIRRLSEFLERPLSENEFRQLKEHVGFENFKKNVTFTDNFESEPKMMIRKGEAGSWKEFFAEEMNLTADEWITKNANEIGIKYSTIGQL